MSDRPAFRLNTALAVAPDATIGVACLYQWFTHDARIDIAPVMAIEFVALWSAGLLVMVMARTTSRLARAVAVLVIVPLLYMIREYRALILLTLNRLTNVLKTTDASADERNVNGFVRSLILYLFWALVTTFAPLPSLGYEGDPTARDLWRREPFRALAFGGAYFLSQAAFKAWAPTWPGLKRR